MARFIDTLYATFRAPQSSCILPLPLCYNFRLPLTLFSMQNVLAIIVVLLLLGGGFYWYMQSSNDALNTIPDVTINTNTPVNTGTNTGTSTNTNATSTGSTTGTVKEITVTNSGMTFTQKTLTVKKGDRVKVTFKNTGGMHDLRIDGYNVGTDVIQANQEDSFEFTADKTGSFEYYCSVGNHRAQGMKGTLTVTN